jgi:hypothetical protein
MVIDPFTGILNMTIMTKKIMIHDHVNVIPQSLHPLYTNISEYIYSHVQPKGHFRHHGFLRRLATPRQESVEGFPINDYSWVLQPLAKVVPAQPIHQNSLFEIIEKVLPDSPEGVIWLAVFDLKVLMQFLGACMFQPADRKPFP